MIDKILEVKPCLRKTALFSCGKVEICFCISSEAKIINTEVYDNSPINKTSSCTFYLRLKKVHVCLEIFKTNL